MRLFTSSHLKEGVALVARAASYSTASYSAPGLLVASHFS